MSQERAFVVVVAEDKKTLNEKIKLVREKMDYSKPTLKLNSLRGSSLVDLGLRYCAWFENIAEKGIESVEHIMTTPYYSALFSVKTDVEAEFEAERIYSRAGVEAYIIVAYTEDDWADIQEQKLFKEILKKSKWVSVEE